MKHILITTIAAVLLVGCATTQQPELPTAKAPDILIHDAAGAGGRKGNIEAVKQYLAAGTDVDAKDKYGRTPLHYAAGHGHKEITEILITKRADVNAKTNDGFTPLDWAILSKQTKTAALLRKHGGKTVQN